MDNKVFNINGAGKDLLLLALELAFKQNNQYPKYWSISPVRGLILHGYKPDNARDFNAILGTNAKGATANSIIDQVFNWVSSNEAVDQMTEWDTWDGDCDNDGSNRLGWRVYCNEWGNVGTYTSAICAIRPVYLWYGK